MIDSNKIEMTSQYQKMIDLLGPLPWHWRWRWAKWLFHRYRIEQFERELAEGRYKPQKPITHFLGVRIAHDDGTPIRSLSR